jgi:hypothetical protein
MAIDFFEAVCTSSTSETVFGIYDVPPATLSFNNSDNWVVWVDNPNGVEITFVAVDHCLNIPDTESERCEAMIT